MSGEPWGRRARDWAELAEPCNEPLFVEVLSRLGLTRGTRLLDVGCGSGYAAQIASSMGATVTGIDRTPELLVIARERVPSGEFEEGSMDCLPFADERFDAVVGFNAFQFAGDAERALREVARVSRPGGLAAAAAFAEPERNESTALHLALEPLRAATADQHLPYGWSEPGGLERLLASAGLEPTQSGEVPLSWVHRDATHAIRAVLSSGGGAMAIEAAGEPAAHAALARAVVPFTRPDGRVEMRNVFRFVIARKAPA